MTPRLRVVAQLVCWMPLSAMLSCAADPSGVGGSLELELSEQIPTVITARWTEAGEDVDGVAVDFETDAGLMERAPGRMDAQGACEATLVGVKPDTEVTVRTVTLIGDDEREGGEATITTGALPAALPRITLDGERHDPSRASGGYLLTTLMPGPAVILDADGDIVWWGQDPEQPAMVSRLRKSVDGESMLTLRWSLFRPSGAEPQTLTRIALDGTILETHSNATAHHDFVELPDGTLALLASDLQLFDGQAVNGDKILEITPDGDERQAWSIWDHKTFEPGQANPLVEYWSHCNALDYDAGLEAYTISSRALDELLRVDRGSGELLWELGVELEDFALISGDDGDWFHNQHQFQLLDDGILVFDNGEDGDASARVVEYTLDQAAGAAELVWAYEPDPPLSVFAFGDVHRHPSGNTLITWSGAGQMDEVTPGGEVVWRINVELGATLGYTTWMASLYDDP